MKKSLKIQAIVLLIAVAISSCSRHNSSFYNANYANNKTATRIADVVPKYQSMRYKSWPIIQANKSIRLYDNHPSVSEIRQRLIIMGDMSPSLFSHGDIYDKQMFFAINTFQWRHGIKQTGIIDKKTLRALNMTPREKLDLLMISMNKWAQYSDINGAHYVLVNIPDFKLKVMRDGDTVMSMNAITGTKNTPTPEVNSKITTVVFNPTWNLPRSIIKNEIAPLVKNNPNYLTEKKINIYENWRANAAKIDPSHLNWHNIHNNGTDLRFTQTPGDHNVLGQVKFLFYNPYDIYLHDTLNKNLFQTLPRTYSHGCVRLEKPLQFAQYLLDNSKLYDINIHDYTGADKTIKYINLTKPLPLHITYIVAWVDEFGYAHFRDNIYNNPL